MRRKVVLVGDDEARAHLRASLGASRGGIIYDFVGEVEPGSDVEDALDEFSLDELIVADTGLDDARLLEIVDHAHRRGVRVRVAPRTAELLIERGEYVPGQGIPLFELRPPTFAGAQWATKRVFDLVVGGLIAIVGLPIWLLVAIAIKLTSRGSDAVRRSAHRPRRAAIPDAQVPNDARGRSRRPGGARAAERSVGRALQDSRRPARDRRRALPAQATRSTRSRT